jgi:exopolysaccharide biosynthesis polyprenyl glycosylphosphotransferase
MKKIEQFLTVIQLPIDAIMIFIAFVVAYQARAQAIGFPVVYIWPFEQYLKLALEMIPVWLVAYALAGLYSGRRKTINEFGQIIAGASLGAMAVVLWVFVFRSDFFSRLIVFYIWILAVITTTIGRAILGLVQSNLHLLGAKKKKLILIGNEDENMINIVEQITKNKSLNYKISGIISNQPLSKLRDVELLGTTEELEQIIKKITPDEIISTDDNVNNEKLFYMMRTCQENEIVFKAIPATAQVSAKTLQFDAFAGIPIIEFKGTPFDSWGFVIKRISDLLFSVLAIILLSPLMLIITIIIKSTSKGPAIYKNTRIGNRGEFATLKFRSMFIESCTGPGYGGSRAEEYEKKLIETNNIKQGEAVYKIANDPRITPIGNFLRKTSLDELPQFFNVFVGNMSLVGPRPHQPREVKNYTAEQRKLLMIKPGITGLAQVSGRSDLTFEEESRLDIFYLENWSVLLDTSIIIRTFSVVFKGKGSY